jgi:hypothetical protein
VDPGNNILSATLALVAIMLASTQLMGSRRSDDVMAFQALFPDPRSSIPSCSFVSFVVKAFAFFPITRSRAIHPIFFLSLRFLSAFQSFAFSSVFLRILCG